MKLNQNLEMDMKISFNNLQEDLLTELKNESVRLDVCGEITMDSNDLHSIILFEFFVLFYFVLFFFNQATTSGFDYY